MDVKLMIAKGSNKGKTLQLRSDETIVGRASGSAIRIPSAAVSRRHCRLTVRDGYLIVEDLGSANGTFVNGTRIQRQAVRPGDRLDIGPLSCVVKYQLTETALERMLREEDTEALVDVEPVESDVPEVEVEALEVQTAEEPVETEPVEIEPVEEVIDVETAEFNFGNKTTEEESESPRAAKKKTATKKKTAAPPKRKAENKKDESGKQDEEVSWEGGPGSDDIRDILSQLE